MGVVMSHLNGIEPFLDRLFAELATAGIDISSYPMDHVCYRVADMDRYEELKHAWGRYVDGFVGYESVVNGRPISVFVLMYPPTIGNRLIPAIELPAPKEGSPYPEGWEHAEFVIEEPFEAFMERYPMLEFDKKGLSKTINPELGLKLGGGLQVKFHHLPLSRVIEIEQEQRG